MQVVRNYVGTKHCDDGFTYELWTRPGVHGFPMYYPATVGTHGNEVLAGGMVEPTPEAVHKAMNLKR